MIPYRPLALGLAALVALAGCKPNEMPQADEGRRLFVENCALCHGPSGRGDGPVAEALKPVPADLTRIAARNGGVFPRAEVLSTLDGYTRTDLDAPGMPEFGDLLRGDLVPLDVGDGVLTPTPRRLVALMHYLEGLQG